MKTIVLDDDPTGTQSATGVTVLLDSDADQLTEALRHADSVYVQTNSRALEEADAVALARQIRTDGLTASARLGDTVRFVLRGDSTLRGHVFAETEVFLDDSGIILFAPAFPEGGRTTREGTHYVLVNGEDIPADRSEYAADPVFPFSTAVLVDYVADKSGRAAVSVPLPLIRAGGLEQVLLTAPPGTVVIPDAVNADDIQAIAAATDAASLAGMRVVVRSAAPLAAELAGVASRGLLARPLIEQPEPVLLVCGSHTAGATAQLRPITDSLGAATVVDTAEALDQPDAAGARVAQGARAQLDDVGLAVITSARERANEHDTLAHGERVMTALTTAVREFLPHVAVVVAKGGITSAEVARTGIGASSARVLGQVLPGVSVWDMQSHDDRRILYVVVPGNVGGPDTLVDILDALQIEV